MYLSNKGDLFIINFLISKIFIHFYKKSPFFIFNIYNSLQIFFIVIKIDETMEYIFHQF